MAGRMLILILCGGALTVAAEETPRPDEVFQKDVQPLVSRYCLKCHGESKPRAGVNLARGTDLHAMLRDRRVWDKARENLDGEIMPPSDAPQPTDGERKMLVGAIGTLLKVVPCDGTPHPGRVTIRRLNRAEYDNTIRDLVGIDFHPAADFPTDDVGEGFDNMGDVLSLSPLLLEKYLAAAEQVAERAIVTDRTRWGEKKTWRGGDLRRAGGQAFGEEGRILSSTGEVKVSHTITQAGSYRVRVRAFGQQAGNEPAKMALRLDGKDLVQVDVPAVEGDPGTYDTRVDLSPGEHALAAAFLNDFYDPTFPDASRRDRNLIVLGIELQGPITQDTGPLPEPHRRILFTEPKNDEPASWSAASRQVLDRFLSRAFRRPVRDEELDRLGRLVEQTRQAGDPFPSAIQLAVEAVLVSPHFLFRVELDRGRNRPRRPCRWTIMRWRRGCRISCGARCRMRNCSRSPRRAS